MSCATSRENDRETGNPAAAPVSNTGDEAPELTETQRREAEEFLRSPDLFDRIAKDIEEIGVVGEQELSLTVYLVFTSRVLPKPLKAVVQGPTSAGKTFVVEKVAELFPEEALFQATSLSDQAWFYLPEGAVQHKAVVLGEREQNNSPERIDTRRAWRELMVSGKASRAVTVKNPATGEFTVEMKTVRGPCAFIETTTSEAVMEEDASRMLPLRACESRQQTLRIIERVALDAAGQSAGPEEIKAIVARHHAAQRLLAEYEGEPMDIPYARLIEVPVDQVIARRVYAYVLGVVRSVARLRTLQKPPELRNQADLADYEIAYPLIRPFVARQLSVVTDIDRETVERLKESGLRVFTAPQVAVLLRVSDRHARRRLAMLFSSDMIEDTDGTRKNRREYRLTGRALSGAEQCLTTPEALREAIEEPEAIQAENEHSDALAEVMSDGM